MNVGSWIGVSLLVIGTFIKLSPIWKFSIMAFGALILFVSFYIEALTDEYGETYKLSDHDPGIKE